MAGNNQSKNYNATDNFVFDHQLDSDSERSRLSWLLTIGLVILAVFATAVWLAYQRGVEQGRIDTERAAAETSGTSALTAVQPTPPTPTSRAAAQAARASTPTHKTPPASGSRRAPLDFRGEAPEPLPADAAEPVPVPVSPPSASVAPTSTMQSVSPVSVAPATSATPSGKSLLQIGSYKSEAEAKSAWSMFKAKHAALLAGANSGVRQVDLGSKGTWYRLLVIADDALAATSLCDKLKADGVACILIK